MPTPSKRQQVIALLHAIGTGDPAPFSVINPQRYTQHNLGISDGLAGIASVVQSQPVGSFKAHVVRTFEDEEFVVTHSEYEFFGPKVGFDVFRFEDGLIVEHWDNLMAVRPLNKSGRSLTDGAVELAELEHTATNKSLVQTFFTENILQGAGTFADYLAPDFIQHNPDGADGLAGLGGMMQFFTSGGHVMRYEKIHQVLGQGNLVLLISEGVYGPDGGVATAFYDLFRVEAGKLVEHWDVLEAIPAKSAWKNSNGKF